jgi:GNAT superfamily N-acetyltransferase
MSPGLHARHLPGSRPDPQGKIAAMTQVRLRPAELHEADDITALARRSKAYWGYDQEFLDRIRELLIVEPQQVLDGQVIVADRDGVLLGFYKLGGEPPEGELADLFVEPDVIGTGVGRKLWEHALRTAKERGFHSLDFESDPHAEQFYLHMGAERTGELEVAPGRLLPIMTISITEIAEPTP